TLENTNQLKQQIRSIWLNSGAISPDGKVTREDVNGEKTYHLKATINKDAFIQALIQTQQIVEQQYGNTSTPITTDQKNALTTLINKIQIQNLDFWVGQK